MKSRHLKFKCFHSSIEEDEFWRRQALAQGGPILRIHTLWRASPLSQLISQWYMDLWLFILPAWGIRKWRRYYDPCGFDESPTKCEPSKVPRVPGANEFRYQTLPSDTHIRLIHILPGAKDSHLCIRISTEILPNAQPFETLSYVWGSLDVEQVLDDQGRFLMVRKNLHDALYALRLEKKERIFWIDAISINQADMTERAEQVALMPKIYMASQKTTIWLGAALNLSTEALALFNSIAGFANQTMVPPGKEDVWRELGELYSNPWFYRVWIIQEIIMARDIVILLNGEPWSWQSFAEASANALVGTRRFQMVLDPSRSIQLANFRATFKSVGPAPTILHALAIGRQALATLDHDKVYALLGLSADSFEVNYDESTTNTYMRVAKFVVDQGGATMLLNYVEDQSFRLQTDLPSWVPDWEVRHGSRSFPIYSGGEMGSYETKKWNASGDAAVYSGLSSLGRHLHLHGYILDTLEHIGNLFLERVPFPGAPKQQHLKTRIKMLDQMQKAIAVRRMLQRIAQWRWLAMHYGTMFATKDARYDAYVCTLVAGFLGTELTPMKRSYKLWCKVWSTATRMDFDKILSAYEQLGAGEMGEASGFIQAHVYAAWGRRLYTTRNRGIVGLCPSLARRGDLLVIIHGGRTPYIIRRLRNGQFKFIGECYAHGLMHGEAGSLEQSRNVEEFVLV
ncbi:heterokaryon incompatibility protein-domain-containing protein [Ustulina deusta]|nr:heterokaryon incompatibility protein-domain-containing protein [Ustulina deusta]